MLVVKAGNYKMLVRIANGEDTLILGCTVCLGLSARQLVFEILENVPYPNKIPLLYLLC